MGQMSFGGNVDVATGQMQILGTALQIPFPTNTLVKSPAVLDPTYKVGFTGMEGRRRKIIATDDIYIGRDANVTAATGYYVPAGKEFDCTTRHALFAIGAQASGQSSSSSLSPVATSGFSSSSSSASPYSSSSNVSVATYGLLFWLEEFDH